MADERLVRQVTLTNDEMARCVITGRNKNYQPVFLAMIRSGDEVLTNNINYVVNSKNTRNKAIKEYNDDKSGTKFVEMYGYPRPNNLTQEQLINLYRPLCLNDTKKHYLRYISGNNFGLYSRERNIPPATPEQVNFIMNLNQQLNIAGNIAAGPADTITPANFNEFRDYIIILLMAIDKIHDSVWGRLNKYNDLNHDIHRGFIQKLITSIITLLNHILTIQGLQQFVQIHDCLILLERYFNGLNGFHDKPGDYEDIIMYIINSSLFTLSELTNAQIIPLQNVANNTESYIDNAANMTNRSALIISSPNMIDGGTFITTKAAVTNTIGFLCPNVNFTVGLLNMRAYNLDNEFVTTYNFNGIQQDHTYPLGEKCHNREVYREEIANPHNDLDVTVLINAIRFILQTNKKFGCDFWQFMVIVNHALENVIPVDPNNYDPTVPILAQGGVDPKHSFTYYANDRVSCAMFNFFLKMFPNNFINNTIFCYTKCTQQFIYCNQNINVINPNSIYRNNQGAKTFKKTQNYVNDLAAANAQAQQAGQHVGAVPAQLMFGGNEDTDGGHRDIFDDYYGAMLYALKLPDDYNVKQDIISTIKSCMAQKIKNDIDFDYYYDKKDNEYKGGDSAKFGKKLTNLRKTVVKSTNIILKENKENKEIKKSDEFSHKVTVKKDFIKFADNFNQRPDDNDVVTILKLIEVDNLETGTHDNLESRTQFLVNIQDKEQIFNQDQKGYNKLMYDNHIDLVKINHLVELNTAILSVISQRLTLTWPADVLDDYRGIGGAPSKTKKRRKIKKSNSKKKKTKKNHTRKRKYKKVNKK